MNKHVMWLKEYLIYEAIRKSSETAIENNGYAKKIGGK